MAAWPLMQLQQRPVGLLAPLMLRWQTLQALTQQQQVASSAARRQPTSSSLSPLPLLLLAAARSTTTWCLASVPLCRLGQSRTQQPQQRARARPR
jgi:hypothetical protein